MMRKGMFLAAIVLLFCGVPSVMGQDMTPYEIGAGYTALYDDPDTFNGFAAFFAYNMTEKYAIVAEVGGNYKSEHVEEYGVTADASASIYDFMAGVQYNMRGEKTKFFFPAMIGIVRATATGSVMGTTIIDESTSEFGYQIGAGLDYSIAEKMAVRVQGDYRGILADEYAGELRFLGGIVYFFGE